jgi:3-hydroxyacyl-CoA dehydrogenase
MLWVKSTLAIKGATDRIERGLKERIKQARLTENEAREARLRIKTVSSLGNAIMDSDPVIKTVPENVVLKRQVLTEIDPLLPQNAFLGTNSSSLPCSRMADVLRRPERFFSINFSQPHEPADNLVELLRGGKTSDEALILAYPIPTYKIKTVCMRVRSTVKISRRNWLPWGSMSRYHSISSRSFRLPGIPGETRRKYG